MRGCIVLAISVLAPSLASALPAWCGKASFDANSADVNSLKRTEPDYAVRAIATVLCSDSDDAKPHHAKTEQMRLEWSKKLGMIDADWADAVAFIDNRDGNYPKIELSAKVMAQFTPMDQYRAIREGLKAGDVDGDSLYVADALHAQLSEVGRLAFIEYCLKERVEHEYMARHAMCQADIDAWDPAKFATQLRGDTAHDAGTRMVLRLRALDLEEALKNYKAERDKMFKKDDTYKKMFDAASKARAEWAKGIGANTKLLELLQSMDSASFAGSRKQFAGCEEKTTAALVEAIGAIPAKAFAGMSDVRDDPFRGFAYKAGPVLVNNPAVNLAANAWAQCQRQTAIGDYLMASLQEVPGVRGPRSAVYGALLNTKLEFDDVNARKLIYPEFYRGRPYSRSGGSISSAGGVVDKVTPGKQSATVKLQKTTAKRVDCVKSHKTGRLSRITSDGRIEYETICDKSAVVTYDTTWTDFEVNLAHASLLKKGVVFSSIYRDKIADVVAIWPSSGATAPSVVLGAKLK